MTVRRSSRTHGPIPLSGCSSTRTLLASMTTTPDGVSRWRWSGSTPTHGFWKRHSHAARSTAGSVPATTAGSCISRWVERVPVRRQEIRREGPDHVPYVRNPALWRKPSIS